MVDRPTLSLKPRPAPQAPAKARRKPFRIGGLPAVSALFDRDPDRAEKLYFDERLKLAAAPFCTRMAAARKPFRLVPSEELEKIAGSAMHGGIVVEASPRPVHPFSLDLAKGWAAAGQPLLILDGVSNPHNLGAIVRTAAFFGVDRIVISDHPGQALPSEAAYRVAEGGFEYVNLHRATGFAATLKALGGLYRTIGTALGPFPALSNLSRQPGGKPVAVVMGNEEHGMPPDSQAACTDLVTIAGSGWVQSLNVSATTAILVFLMTKG
ncbi:TrmH family RNA methyltransferase [Niveispirillum cyanobacteriorum]|uniref:RNA methyltransferase n=1 Tax=Niveispirillum cyanobacteriorum TaxID=1612173 RepID=A0A2K9NAP5_9PROT|nr:RNA methyltransferase [Niveispirillum cyanobacteriorum]AUN30157.1 RNA methyltransferase [Niveispirillum cyanobacteriorum]GGE57421.1 RNA methyltransferase [Niveispirillum cyanobacteriorum]